MSQGTSTFGVAINGQGVQPSQVTSSCTAPTSGTKKCTLDFPAPAGSDVFVLALGDANGDVLSEGTVTAAIQSGQTTTLHLTFLGVPAWVSLQLDNANPLVGAASVVHLSATAYDASRNQIIGDDYLTPITIASDDKSGQVTLGGLQFTNPASTIDVHYSGKLLANPVTFSVAAPASSSNSPVMLIPDPEVVMGSTRYPVFSMTAGHDGSLWFAECASNTGPCRVGKITTSGTLTESSDLPYVTNVAAGPDGNVWFTEGTHPYIGRITPGGQITQFLVRTLKPNEGFSTTAIVGGPDGNLWISDCCYIYKMTTSGSVTSYPGRWGPAASMLVGPDGAIWLEEGGYLDRMTTSGTLTRNALSNLFGGMEANLIVGPDKNLYVNFNGLKRMTTSGTVTSILIAPNTVSFGAPLSTGPDAKVWGWGADSAYSWRHGVVELSVDGSVNAVYAAPKGLSPTANTDADTDEAWGSDGNLWFGTGNDIVRFRYNP
ncbi:MAG: hypothetical protein ACLQPV_02655 [Vulcanimicrobiaceae bacterium]